MPRAIASPMPVPSVSNLWRRPRKNFSKIRRRSFSSMPGPRSATLITILPPFSSAVTETGEPSGVYLSAFSTSCFRTCPANSESASAAGMPGAVEDVTRPACATPKSVSTVSISSVAVMGRRSRCSLPASIRAISITSAARRFRRSASSSMIVSNSWSAPEDCPNMLVTAALMEVSGVLMSWARESRSAAFSISLCRAASAWLASSSARAFSMASATRLTMARAVPSDGGEPASARLPSGRPPKRTGAITSSFSWSIEMSAISAAARRSCSEGVLAACCERTISPAGR